MDILLHLDQKTAYTLETLAHQRGQKLDVFALEALRSGLAQCRTPQWPQEILNFQGIADMPTFESYRAELLPSQDDPLA